MNAFLQAYIEAALWSSNDESDESGGEPMDKNYSINDLAPETLSAMKADCEKFQEENQIDGNTTQYSDDEMAGHDFWLTRCGHGCGFWDGDWEEPFATKLTESSKRFGEVNLYVGDDGLIYHA